MLSRKDKQDCLDGFEMHIERLKNAVPLESLLIYNIREGWDPLCRFLGVPVPDFPFPREDSYSMIHWKVGPVIFLVVVYLFYGLVLLLLHFILRLGPEINFSTPLPRSPPPFCDEHSPS